MLHDFESTTNIEVKNKLIVTRREGEEVIMGKNRGKSIKENV